jgi:hypothetical protein
MTALIPSVVAHGAQVSSYANKQTNSSYAMHLSAVMVPIGGLVSILRLF